MSLSHTFAISALDEATIKAGATSASILPHQAEKARLLDRGQPSRHPTAEQTLRRGERPRRSGPLLLHERLQVVAYLFRRIRWRDLAVERGNHVIARRVIDRRRDAGVDRHRVEHRGLGEGRV